MTRAQRWILFLSVPLAGFAAGTFFGLELDAARAGGVCQTPGGNFITANADGDVIHEWITTPGRAQVIRYSFATGKAERKLLVHEEATPAETEKPAAPPAAEEGPEVVISGVIWVSDPEKRVAIINGSPIREGEIFTTRSGRRYRVTEIKKSDEVAYEEVKD